MTALLKNHGAKWSLAEWIISRFPPHHSYLEPFFGSGAVLFNKPRSNIETVNDLDGDVVNLFECIRRDPEKLGRMAYYTPYSRQEYERSCSREIPTDPFDRAARFLIRCNQGHGFRTNEIPGGLEERRAGPGAGLRRQALGGIAGGDLPGGGTAAGRPDRVPAGGGGDRQIQRAQCPDLLRPALCAVF